MHSEFLIYLSFMGNYKEQKMPPDHEPHMFMRGSKVQVSICGSQLR